VLHTDSRRVCINAGHSSRIQCIRIRQSYCPCLHRTGLQKTVVLLLWILDSHNHWRGKMINCT
jgi:hypothetical protein